MQPRTGLTRLASNSLILVNFSIPKWFNFRIRPPARSASWTPRRAPWSAWSIAGRMCIPWRFSKFLIFSPHFWLVFGTLWEARSRLYRRYNLQLNARLKALDEIYKIYSLLHRSTFENSAKVRFTFSHFCVLIMFILKKYVYACNYGWRLTNHIFNWNFSNLYGKD